MVTRINLHDHFISVDPDQVCRTCVHQHDRLHDLSVSERVKLRQEGVDLNDYKCDPATERTVTKVVRRIPVQAENKPAEPETTAVVTADTDLTSTDQVRLEVHAVVDTCGQTLAPNCMKCSRFRPVTANVPYRQYPGGPVRYRAQVVGGHCSIPPEGIEVNGQVVTCAPIVKRYSFEPSCLNCEFLDRTRGLDEHLRISAVTDLNRFEMDQVRKHAQVTNEPVGLEIWRARQAKFAKPTMGTLMSFTAKILDTKTTGADTTLVTDYFVEFVGSGASAWITSDDDFVRIYPTADGHRALALIQTPHHKRFGLSDQRSVSIRQIPKPTYPDSDVEIPSTMRVPQHLDRIRPGCAQCKPTQACHWHVKGGRYNVATDTYEMIDPLAEAYVTVPTPQWTPVVHIDADTVRVCDATGAPLHPWVFRLKRRELCSAHPDHVQAIHNQYLEAVRGYRIKNVALDIGYGQSDNQVIPNTAYCSHPHGLDFRAVMGDTFGLPREAQDKSWKFQMESQSMWRAGITPTARHEREFSVQRLHEEILANEALDAERTGHFDDHAVAEWHHVRLDTFGEPLDVDDDNPLPDDFDEADRAAYQEWLDTQYEQHVIDEYTVEDWDSEGQIRHILTKMPHKITWTNRQAVHGYELFRGRRMNHEQAPEVALRFRGKYDVNDRDAVIESGYQCLSCDATYPLTSPEVSFTMVCTACGGGLLYRDFEAHLRMTPARTPEGMSTILLKDKPYYLEQTRLMSMSCPHWQRRNSSFRPITLARLGYEDGPVTGPVRDLNWLERNANAFRFTTEERNARAAALNESQQSEG